jgi:DNA-binding MarR family transcriptional regulator
MGAGPGDAGGAPRRNLLLLLDYAHRKLDAGMLARLRAAGFPEITPAHSQVFGTIATEGSRVGEMAARAGIAQQSMSELVDNLEQHGYLARRPDPRDRRAKIVILTERGWAAVRAAVAALDEIERDWSTRIGVRDAAALRSALEKIAQL